jgi:hypothetical protein
MPRRPPEHLQLREARLEPFVRHALAAIMVTMLALSAGCLWLEPPDPGSGQNGTWWPIVVSVLEGRGYTACFSNYFPFCHETGSATASREPVPVLVFAAVAALTQRSFWAAALVEVALYLSVGLAIFLLTRTWTNDRTALLATAMWCVYLPAYGLLPQMSGELIASAGVAFGLFFVLRARESARARDWIAAGAALGFAVLSRSACLVIVVAVVGGTTVEQWRNGRSLRAVLRPVSLISLTVAVLLAPWMVRNTLTLGRPIWGSSLTGYNLYRHNHQVATDDYLRYVRGNEASRAVRALLARRPDLRGVDNEAELDAAYRAEALRIIAAKPLRYALLTAYRFLPLWFDWGIPEIYGGRRLRKADVILAEQAVLLVLMTIGAFSEWRRAWPLWASVAVFCLSYMAVNSQLRYIVPIMPLVMSLSAQGAVRLTLKKTPGRSRTRG